MSEGAFECDCVCVCVLYIYSITVFLSFWPLFSCIDHLKQRTRPLISKAIHLLHYVDGCECVRVCERV